MYRRNMDIFLSLLFFGFFLLPLKVFGDYPWRNKDVYEKSELKSDSGKDQFDLSWRSGGRKDKLTLDLQSFYVFKKEKFAVFPGMALVYNRPAVHIDLGYQYDLFEKEHYYRVSELELNFPFPAKEFLLSIGFKNHVWSRADRYWNHGLWQSRYLIDPLRPKQMGLPGIYLKYKGESSLLFYVSPLAVPDFNVRPRLVKGRPFSKNPFFIGSFMAEKSKFNWSLDKLKSFGLLDLLKPSGGIQIKHKLPYSTLSLSYAYKTANQLHYSVLATAANPSGDSGRSDGKLNLSELPDLPSLETASTEEPTKKPDLKLFHIKDLMYSLNYHHLTTLEAEMFPASDLSIIGSITYENPEDIPSKGSSWISENKESHLTASILLQVEETVSSQSEAFFTLAYSNVFEIDRRTANSNAWIEPYEAYFTGGTDWKNALAMSLEYRTRAFFQENQFNIRLNYALDNKLYLLSLENRLFISPAFRIYLAGDLFFLPSRSNTVFPSSSYIIRYKNLSRVIAGAEYVF